MLGRMVCAFVDLLPVTIEGWGKLDNASDLKYCGAFPVGGLRSFCMVVGVGVGGENEVLWFWWSVGFSREDLHRIVLPHSAEGIV